MIPLRFRAYAAAEATRKVPRFDADGKPVISTKTGLQRKLTVSWTVEEPAFEGETKGRKAEFDAGDTEIVRVVFYAGEAEAEVVCGSVEVDETGLISVELPEEEDDEEED